MFRRFSITPVFHLCPSIEPHQHRADLASASLLKGAMLLVLLLAGCHSSISDKSRTPQSSSQVVPSLQAVPSQGTETTESSSAFHVSVPLPEPIPATKPWNIAYVIKSQSDPYWQRVKQAAIAIGDERGIEMTVLGPENGYTKEAVETQISLIAEHFEQNQLDGLILGPSDSIRLAPIVEKLTEQGIPVMAMDTPLDTEAVLTFIGFDNFAAGEAMGKWVIQYWATQKQTGTAKPKPPKILMLEGARHNDNAIERQAGFLAGLNTGAFELLAIRSANWSTAEAQEITRQWLEQYPQIDVIVAANDGMALGAIAAMAEQNRTDILVTGFDGSDAGLSALENGTLAATIAQIPEPQTQMAIELMINHLEQQTVLPPTVLLGNLDVITPSPLDPPSE